MQGTYTHQMVRELAIRGYSLRTIQSYTHCVNEFNTFCNGKTALYDSEKIKDFIAQKLTDKVAPQTVSVYINAIKFFYYNIIGYHEPIKIRHPKKKFKIPVVLSRTEIQRILDTTKNTKHRLILALAYGAGLRVSEVQKICIQDIDFENNTIHIKDAKGGKDRLSILPQKIKDDLCAFIKISGHQKLVFPSQQMSRLSIRTLQKIFTQSCRRASIHKHATFHSLRHSFATHLLENSIDIRYIQTLLGHNNIRTTQRYTTVTNQAIRQIKSPL